MPGPDATRRNTADPEVTKHLLQRNARVAPAAASLDRRYAGGRPSRRTPPARVELSISDAMSPRKYSKRPADERRRREHDTDDEQPPADREAEEQQQRRPNPAEERPPAVRAEEPVVALAIGMSPSGRPRGGRRACGRCSRGRSPTMPHMASEEEAQSRPAPAVLGSTGQQTVDADDQEGERTRTQKSFDSILHCRPFRPSSRRPSHRVRSRAHRRAGQDVLVGGRADQSRRPGGAGRRPAARSGSAGCESKLCRGGGHEVAHSSEAP